MTTPLTPNLDLYLPTPSEYDQSPSWGALLNQNFQILDGLVPSVDTPLTPNRFSINQDLEFSGWGALNLGVAAFTPQSSDPSPLTSNYFLTDGEFYVTDGAGNHVQMTNAGSVNAPTGNIAGLPSTPAGAAITWNNAAGEFQFLGAGGTVRPTLAVGPLAIYDVASGPPANAVTLKSPAALAAGYSLTFPAALPASFAVVAVSSAGALTFQRNTPTTTTAPPAGAWTGTITVWKDANGYVHMSGNAVLGSGAVSDICTLPVGYRPVSPSSTPIIPIVAIPAVALTPARFVAALVNASGVITALETPVVGERYNLNAITFYAGN